MPFEFKKILNHGAGNPIVARLSLQTLDILKHCNVSKDVSDKVGLLYVEGLQNKLIRCWEIKERFRVEFNEAAEKYKPPTSANAPVEIPQVSRLEQECHNFLYEAKSYMRDLLFVVNKLYGTNFREASEFSKGDKRGNGKSLIEFVEGKFGPDDAKTQMLKEAIPFVEELIAKRNAAEHPEGHSGTLIIKNFEREPDQKLREPIWYREKNGARVVDESSIRADLETIIINLLTLGEDILASWANDNLPDKDLMQISHIPEGQRNPECPVKYKIAPGPKLAEALNRLPTK